MGTVLTLLIVDGHTRARTALVDGLQRLPTVKVLAAVSDVAAALPLIGELAPDLVLFEPMTIDSTTIPVLQVLITAGRPVVVLTPSLVPGESDMLIHAGAKTVLLKDPDLSTLLAGIEAARSQK